MPTSVSLPKIDTCPWTLRNGHWVARIIAANVKSKAVSSPVRSSARQATLRHHTIPSLNAWAASGVGGGVTLIYVLVLHSSFQ